MSGLFGNHIVGFPTGRLKCWYFRVYAVVFHLLVVLKACEILITCESNPSWLTISEITVTSWTIAINGKQTYTANVNKHRPY